VQMSAFEADIIRNVESLCLSGNLVRFADLYWRRRVAQLKTNEGKLKDKLKELRSKCL